MNLKENSFSVAEKHNCPECGSQIPKYPHYSTWCDKCHWNIQPESADSIHSHFHAWVMKTARQIDQNRFTEIVNQKDNLKKITRSKIIAVSLATIVFALLLTALFLTISLIFSPTSLVYRSLGLVLSLIIIWVIIPRTDKLSSNHQFVQPEEAPQLHNIVQEVANGLGIRVDNVLLTNDFSASFRRCGLLREPSLSLGHPFVSLLAPQELVSLIAHELSHGQDGAVTRSIYVRTALGSLRRLQWLVTPSVGLMERWHRLPLALRIIYLLPICLGTTVGLPFGALAALIELFCFQDSQRAEYIADARSISVAGNRPALTLLRKSYLQYMGALLITYQRATPENKHEALIQQLRSIPPREIDRIWHIAKQQPAKLRTTHPSLRNRLAFLESYVGQDPTITISAESFRRLQAELAQWPLLVEDKKTNSPLE